MDFFRKEGSRSPLFILAGREDSLDMALRKLPVVVLRREVLSPPPSPADAVADLVPARVERPPALAPAPFMPAAALRLRRNMSRSILARSTLTFRSFQSVPPRTLFDLASATDDDDDGPPDICRRDEMPDFCSSCCCVGGKGRGRVLLLAIVFVASHTAFVALLGGKDAIHAQRIRQTIPDCPKTTGSQK